MDGPGKLKILAWKIAIGASVIGLLRQELAP
jgi:hypothetical protein